MAHTKKETYGEKVNFLASEVGLRLVTAQFDATGITANANGKKLVKGGTIVDGKGIVFEDVDVTDGEHEGALVVAGHILNDKLPVAASEAQITEFAKQGLYFEDAVTAERPTA